MINILYYPKVKPGIHNSQLKTQVDVDSVIEDFEKRQKKKHDKGVRVLWKGQPVYGYGNKTVYSSETSARTGITGVIQRSAKNIGKKTVDTRYCYAEYSDIKRVVNDLEQQGVITYEKVK